jgi:predicted amidohydrolase YtcJ
MTAPDLVVTNGRIYSGATSEPPVEALSVRRGRIVRLGPRRALEREADSHTELLDVEGRTVLPGFIDAHCHFIWGFELGQWIDLSDRPSLEEVLRRVHRYGELHPEDTVILGHGFDYAALGEGVELSAHLLDGAVRDRPVLLTAWDGHTGWANTAFLSRAESVTRRFGPEVGEIQREPKTRRPTGLLFRAFDLTPHLPEFQQRRSLEGLRRVLTAAVGYGLTTAFDVQVNLEDVHAYEELRNRNELPLRIRAALYHPRGTPRSRYGEFMAAVARSHDDWFGVGAVKLYVDGVQETGTAALLAPYANDPRSRGSTVYAPGQFRAIVRELDRLGFQVLAHACGDRAVRIALDAYAEAAERNRMSGRRHRIEHCENLAAEDIPRFAQLGVIPCMMPRHSAPELTVRWRAAVGEARAQAAFPWQELRENGAALAFASDWPVADLNPWVGIQSAVLRTDPAGDPSPHRLSVTAAIDAYTRGAAFASHCDQDRGTLAAGKYADLVVVSQDPFSIPFDRLGDTRTVATLVEGRTVFADPEILPEDAIPRRPSE